MCSSFKTGTGKCLVFFFTIAFGLGVIASCFSPQWIAVSAADTSDQNQVVEVRYGPFYSQNRTCVDSQCSPDWTIGNVGLHECDSMPGDKASELCRKWSTLTIMCLLLVVLGGVIVLAGSCCQCLTCGCCGGSMDCIANVLFWIEVVLSICAWSLAIALVREIDHQGESAGYMWGFWLFLFSATVLGAISATMADWAAEKSWLRSTFRCLTCR